MYPIVFSIGAFQLHSYGVMAAAGFLLASWVLSRNCRYAGITADQASNMLLISLISGIAGARIFYVVQFFHQFRSDLWRIFRIDQGGLVFYGGLLFALVWLWVYSRCKKIDFVRSLDLFTPAIAIAHFCGRIGCFLHGCCFGAPTRMPWGVVYPAGSIPFARYGSQALHPVQLYEAAGSLVLTALYIFLLRKAPRGVVLSAYMILYGGMRFLDELVRGDNPRVLWGMTPAQLIGVVFVPCGIGFMLYFLKKAGKDGGKSIQNQHS